MEVKARQRRHGHGQGDDGNGNGSDKGSDEADSPHKQVDWDSTKYKDTSSAPRRCCLTISAR
jgi:hypothetical protein